MTVSKCLACSGSGLGDGEEDGQLLPLCRYCEGHGALSDRPPAAKPYVAMFLVGKRFVVRLVVPKTRGVVELDVEWMPKMPPKRGPNKLKASERAQYVSGRDQALRTLRLEMGGSYELVEASARH